MTLAVLAAAAALVGQAEAAREEATSSGPREAIVWAVGDGADGSTRSRRLANLIAADDPDRFLYLGDVYETGSADEFEQNYAGVYGDLASITEPTPGNHEWPNRRVGYYPYWASVKGRRQPPWYRFRVAGWEVFSLNSEAAHGPGSRQARWLRSRLAGADGDCRIAFLHRPRFSAGTYGDDSSYEPFWRTLTGKARVVLSGHDHNMQRLRPSGGIIQFVVGSGGRELYPLRPSGRLAFGRDRRFGALRLELSPGRAEIEFRRIDGRRLDHSSVRCEPG